MLVIVGIDAARGEDGDVNTLQEARIGQVQGANDIVSDGLLLVILTPVDIWSPSRPSSVQNVCGLHPLQLSDDSLSVLHTNGGSVDLLAWRRISSGAHPRGI